MTFAALPLALLVAACAIPPLILLYFLKLRRQERAVPSTLLWMNAVQDLQANAPFQKLKPNLLLFLQLLALLLLLLAIAQPEWVGDLQHQSRTILLIDRSASMTARLDSDDGRTRLDEAKAQAIEYIQGMDSGGFFNPLSEPEQLMVIAFSNGADVRSRFTSNKTQLIKAIEDITPSHGSTTIKDALSLARAHATVTDPEGEGALKKNNAQIILFSDGRIHDLSTQVAKESIAYRRIGTPADDQLPRNAAIVAFDAERNFKDLTSISVYTRVANYNPMPIRASILYSIGDQLVTSESIEIPAATAAASITGNSDTANSDTESSGIFDTTPGLQRWVPGTASVSIKFPDSNGIMLGAELVYTDDLPADNMAFVVVPPAKQLKVALVNSKVFVLKTALEGIPFIERIHNMTGAQFEQLQTAGEMTDFDVIIFDDYSPTTLFPGRYLTFGKLPPIEGYGRAGTERIWHYPIAWDSAHPINYNVNYASLSAHYLPAKIPAGARPIVEGADDETIISEISEGGVHAVVVPFTPRESNLPWDIMVVLFIQNAVDYLGHLGDAVASESSHPGGVIVARLPAEAQSITMQLPSIDDQTGPEMRLTPSDPSYTTYQPVDLSGLYEMKWEEPGAAEERSKIFAVNMFNLLESDIRTAPAVRFPGDVTARIADDGGLRKRQLWPYALFLCLLVLTVEWFVYGRRAYI